MPLDRRFRSQAIGLAGALLLALGDAGCGHPAKTVVLDLVAELPVADRESGADVILFGTPAAERHQGRGFLIEARPPSGDRYAWARRETQVLLSWPDAAPRAAVLDLAPYPGLESQTLEVLFGGLSVGRFDLDGRRRYRVLLPPERQQIGVNRLDLVFGKVAPPGNPHGRRLAAAVYSLTVAHVAETTLDALIAPGAPPPFSVTAPEGAPSLVQLGPSAVRYAFKLPEEAELRFTPSLHPASREAGGSARLRVTLDERPGAEREIWSGPVDARGAPSEVSVPLSGTPAAPVRLGLHVSGERPVWALWSAPRILRTRREAGPPAPSTAVDPKLESLRRSLLRASVLLIVLDAGGARHFGCYGYPRATTPEIDRIAAEGVVFEEAFTPAVFTLGAIGSIWTSLYPDEHHRGVPYAAPLPRGSLTLAELLGAQGVTTAGWVANGMAGPGFGLDRGFAEFNETYRGHGFNADAFRELLAPWLEAHKDRRFFAYAHFREPHFPYDPPPPFDTRFGPDGPIPRRLRSDQGWIIKVNTRRVTPTREEAEHLVRLYDGGLAFADAQVGALRKALEASGLWDRTVVIVTADHGEALLEHGFVGHNEQLYDESVRIPLIVRFPRSASASGVRVRALVDLLDLAPTIADVFGVLGKGGSDRAFEGQTLLPVVFGAPGKPAVFTRNAAGEKPSYALRDGRFVFLHNMRYGEEALFDRSKDPGETNDLAPHEPIETAYYRQALFRWFLGLKRGAEAEDVSPANLTPEQRENLRALGYVN